MEFFWFFASSYNNVRSESWLEWFFLRKNPILRFWQKWPKHRNLKRGHEHKMKFFRCKSVHGTFLFFSVKLQQNKDLKLSQMIFWEKLAFDVFGIKDPCFFLVLFWKKPLFLAETILKVVSATFLLFYFSV